jgi:fumigallin biosynthesis monooxygenase-like protein
MHRADELAPEREHPVTPIHTQRMTAWFEGEVVVFLIGMRINRLWKIHKWLPVALAMPRMVKELAAAPEYGFLAAEQWLGNPTIMVQYWRSFEHLERYARNRSAEHLPAWAAFNRAVASNGDVGIWHETYRIRPGDYECIYNNMPTFGLARATTAVPAAGARESARGRLLDGAAQ